MRMKIILYIVELALHRHNPMGRLPLCQRDR
jgi:hypothetical protein